MMPGTACSTAARGLSDQISRHLFAHVESRDRTVTLLFDREHNLEERILNEQFQS
mgnify:CR=1 FL=1